MGYAYYEIKTPEGKNMKRGYGVSCKCHQRGCKERIDRGVSYLCYSCTQYFCYHHLTFSEEKNECFAGGDVQCCFKCVKNK